LGLLFELGFPHMRGDLLQLIAEVLGVDLSEIGEDSDNTSVRGWDSATEVELALMLEHEFSISLDEGEMSALISVRNIRSTLAKHGVALGG
jgi:acyl carrier protein